MIRNVCMFSKCSSIDSKTIVHREIGPAPKGQA